MTLPSPCFVHHHQGSEVRTFLLTRPWLHSSISLDFCLSVTYLSSLSVSATTWDFLLLTWYFVLLLPLFFDPLKYFLVHHEFLWQFQMKSFATSAYYNFLLEFWLFFFSFLWLSKPLGIFLKSFIWVILTSLLFFLLLGQTPFQMLPNFSFRTEVQVA